MKGDMPVTGTIAGETETMGVAAGEAETMGGEDMMGGIAGDQGDGAAGGRWTEGSRSYITAKMFRTGSLYYVRKR